MRASGAVQDVLRAQQGHLLPWVPVCLACGIGAWFSLRVEPTGAVYALVALAVCGLILLARLAGEVVAPVLCAILLVGLGFLLAGARAHHVAEPRLGFRYYGPIQGRVVDIDRSGSDALRLTLDRVRLDDVRPEGAPTRVRVSLHGEQGHVEPVPGITVILTGHLSPPGGPVEPGGFDFGRLAWFEGLGAVGYTRTPVLALAPPEPGLGLVIFRTRIALSSALQERIPGPAGAFVAAVLSGDRSGLPREHLDALRASNLAHLLAISGLHMGLLTGVVFAAIRFAIAALPWLALRVPGKKIAAVGALLAGAAYLALSGGNVATIRAFVMVSVMLGAVLLGRRAISLRSVAIAAILILVATPEALSGPGFQMSFAATVALVAAFASVRSLSLSQRLPGWALPVATLVVSSAVAGFATAPFGAAHFNMLSDYGLLANLLSVPAMGAVVMPAAVAAAVLWPVGLDWIALEVMRLGAEWILYVAEIVSGLDGSVTRVLSPHPAVLPLLSFGALFWILWQGRLRHAGVIGVATAMLIWSQTSRPSVLIAETGGLVGVQTDAGRALSKPKGDGFAARVWLENDGDREDQATAADRSSDWKDGRLDLGPVVLVHATGRKLAQLPLTCAPNEIWVVSKAPKHPPAGGCKVLDPELLRTTGAIALDLIGDTYKLETARDRSGYRLWNTSPQRRRPQ